MAWYNQIDTVKKMPLGSIRQDVLGYHYIYTAGVASLAANDFVMHDHAYALTRTVANVKGPIGIAQSANTSTTNYSWVGIRGNFTGNVATGADGGKVWVTATPGRVDNTDVAVDLVTGAIQRGATASNTATFQLNWPFAHNEVLN